MTKKFRISTYCRCELINKIVEAENKEEARRKGMEMIEDKFDFAYTNDEAVTSIEEIEED